MTPPPFAVILGIAKRLGVNDMSIPPAQNGEESGRVALAAVSELIDLLVSKQVIGGSEVAAMLALVVNRLNAQPNAASKRAAARLATQLNIEE
jgi:hypothetical protein